METLSEDSSKGSQQELVEKNKKINFFKNDIFRTVFISAITVVFTQILTYYSWTKQFDNNKKQKLNELKTNSLEKFSNIASRTLHLSEFGYRFRLEEYIEINKMIDNIRSTGKSINKLPADSLYVINEHLSKKQPLLYDRYTRLLDIQDDYNSVMATAQLLFDPKTSKEIMNFSQSLLENALVDNINKEMTSRKVELYEINKDSLVRVMIAEREKQLNNILNLMLNEIKDE